MEILIANPGTYEIAKRYGLSEKRQDEIQKFIDGIFEKLETEDMHNCKIIESIAKFSDNVIEAMLIWGWLEVRYQATSLAEKFRNAK